MIFNPERVAAHRGIGSSVLSPTIKQLQCEYGQLTAVATDGTGSGIRRLFFILAQEPNVYGLCNPMPNKLR
jgi:hypothetical protein